MVEDQNKPCKCEGDEVQIEMAKSKAQVKKQGHHDEPNHHSSCPLSHVSAFGLAGFRKLCDVRAKESQLEPEGTRVS